MGGRDKLLNGGAIIPVPEASEGTAQRTSSALLWGEVVDDPKPFPENTRKRGQLLKIVLVVRIGKTATQRINVSSDSPWFFAVRALKKHDRVAVMGVYAENDGYTKDESGNRVPKLDKKTGEQMVYRDVYIGFIMPEIAVTDPDAWKQRLHEVPDPFYEAQELVRAKEERQLLAEAQNEGLDYTNQAFNPFTRGGGGW